MHNGPLLEEKFRLDFLLRRIARRNHPPVSMVDEGTEDYHLVIALMEQQGLSDAPRMDLAGREGIPVICGLEVVENLRGEMAPDAEWILRSEVRAISAATQGAVVLPKDDPERGRVEETGESLTCRRWVTVEELVEGDLGQANFPGYLENLAHDHPIPFTIPPTEKVLAFLGDRGSNGGVG